MARISRWKDCVAFPSPVWFVVQACEGSFCEKFCDFITSKVKWKTNTIIFTIGYISLVMHVEIGSVEKLATSVEMCRLWIYWTPRGCGVKGRKNI